MTSTTGQGVNRKWAGVDGVMSSEDVHTVYNKIHKFIFKSSNVQSLKLYNK